MKGTRMLILWLVVYAAGYLFSAIFLTPPLTKGEGILVLVVLVIAVILIIRDEVRRK